MATYRGMFLHDLNATEIDALLTRGAAIEDLDFNFGTHDEVMDSSNYLSEYSFFQTQG